MLEQSDDIDILEKPVVVIESKDSTDSVKYDFLNWFSSPNYIMKSFSGGYENSGYTEDIFGVYENKILTVREDTGTIVAFIYEFDDDGIYLVYSEENAEDVTISLLDTFEKNRNDFIYPRHAGLGDQWHYNNRDYCITSVNKLVEIDEQSYNTIEITTTTEFSTMIVYLSEDIGIVKTYNDGLTSELKYYNQ